MKLVANLIRLALVGLAFSLTSAFAAECVSFETAYIGTSLVVRKPNGVVTQGLVAWDMGAASVDASGNYVCSAGGLVLLTPAEVKAQSDLRIKDTFGTATPEQYQALLVLFGAFLTAGCLVWGVLQILNYFRSGPES